MKQNIQSIFDSITPDNIQSVPIIKDAMAVFIETLEELASESIDITNAFKNTKIKEEIVKIYLDDIYNVLQRIKFNKKISDYIDRYNGYYGTDYYKKEQIFNIVDYINEDHFLTVRSYKEKKGTLQATRYIYDLISAFVLSNDLHHPFTLKELDPFNFKVEGSLPAVFYENIIRPLAHPLGFMYIYEQILKIVLEDFYSDPSYFYHTSVLEVRCLKPTGETYTFDFLYKPDGTKRVVATVSTSVTGNTRDKITTFRDGTDKFNHNATYLKQTTTGSGQTTVVYMQSVHLEPGETYRVKKDYNGNTVYDQSGNPVHVTSDYVIRTFSDQCSVYHEYRLEVSNALEEKFTRTDLPVRTDYWARLDIRSHSAAFIGYIDYNELPGGFDIGSGKGDTFVFPDEIGEFYITDTALYNIDLGYNRVLNADNILVQEQSDEKITGRYENHFAPSWGADLKVLEGKFETVSINKGPYLQVFTQYGDTVKQAPVVTRVNTVQRFIAQNEGNSEYTAREHIYEDHLVNLTSDGVLIEPVYTGVPKFIDYNGDDRGPGAGAMRTIGDIDTVKLIGVGGESTVGYSIGGYYDNSPRILGNPNWVNNDPAVNAIPVFKTVVDADPVNLQYYTYDIKLVEYKHGISETFPERTEVTLSTLGTTRDDSYGYYDTNSLEDNIGESRNINDFTYILGKPFHGGILPGTNTPVIYLQTPAVIELTHGFDDTTTVFLVSTPEIYEYCTFEDAQAINGFTLGDSTVITGKVQRTEVSAEVYRGSWSETGTGNDLYETFACSVYRGGTPLTDGNISKYPQ